MVNLSNGSGAAGCGLAAVVLSLVAVLGSCSAACSSGSHSSSSRHSSSSSSSYSTYSDGKGNNVYTYSDGTREATDGYGHVVRDSDGDGKADKYSSDGGSTWSKL
jgi:hypothetical protein